MTKLLLSFSLCLFMLLPIHSQAPEKPNSAEIHEAIKKLNFLGSVLYLAAHPDDENTRMISYFSNEVHARTAYLSITRGDGGQNLIGPEIRELLGVIRTNELLKARETDGGEQFFTRANDFGYSKHPDETLEIWNEEMVMNDVVTVIRKFRPDIIINRFNAESAGKTHGHHTSSAMLSTEAFDLAADASYKTESYQPWTTQRLFFNTHWWFYGSRENFEKVDKSGMLWFDTGVYYPSLGLSNSEIASLSRSMHKSQGFGSTGSRGTDKEYVQLLKGKMPEDKNNVFEGVDTSWLRVEGGEAIKMIMDKVQKDFDFSDPSKSIPDLLKALSLIEDLEDTHWREIKLKQIKKILTACSGLYLEAVATNSYVTKGEEISVKIEAINRSEQKMKLLTVEQLPLHSSTDLNKELQNNISIKEELNMHVDDKAILTSPYWLKEKGSLGMYSVQDHSLIGNPISVPAYKILFRIDFEGTTVDFERDIIYKFNDPVKGEVYQPFEIVPAAVSHIASKVVIFNDDQPKEIPVKIKGLRDNVTGEVVLNVPKGWKVSPQNFDFQLKNRGEELDVIFTVVPTEEQSEGYIKPSVKIDGNDYDKSMVEINYDHIPKQSVLLPSESKVVRLNLDKKGESIAYIKGAGDEVPKYLKQIGYEVTEIAPENISVNNLLAYDAVILGIRAYNTVPELKMKQAAILEYVKQGGNVIVQYNTSHSLVVEDNLAPYELELSRDRITDENAKVTFVNEAHEVLNYPNKITSEDFDGWVQERGLYFPDKWGKEFSPVISFKENGDKPMEGSLLVAKYGKGHYIYTGLSFFRELPAGVPGAYKLLTNMISIGKNDFETQLKE
ncbi:PIG-L family deacetylase [Lutimonas halocynthiae]|uniref:PIG-L family deacetylase n=1 Tax=Lutimonas halocynthiae TaxID=1446477 RepID=UPI0025B41DA5|nr:PIG-L family deacetylase [Lutimonas halocynthiae]MDN3643402.1 PIG-L family deacetylase [Lutimonas halocynthiae]